ncbi:glycosyltransferase family 2 protein [Novosphingobium guangzhouense]|uniref:Glycosyltransferase n=1 Tax=Novosphingobium guangzhouense TaxID=1850347 RepID=A0A2K2FZM3_9SPHN|nr:glycosyltransferase family 2 protein [Novosphingobium guangzhouense]PNU04212.1 glycosyltransferase [Novosphingobium guangzhouense]
MKMEPILPFAERTCPRLSVVVPCFNEEAVLLMLEARLAAACREQVGEDYEIVLVNDGSTDRTWPLICVLAERNPRVLGVDLSRNHGHQLAVTAGLQVCRGDLIMMIDADLQDPPELLGAMIAKIDAGADVVYGQRVARHGESRFKRGTASLFYKLLNRLSEQDIPVDTGDFRLMTRRVVDQLNAMPERYRFIRGMVSWIGFEQVALPYERAPRAAGETHYPLRRMVRLALDAITSFSTVPLRMASHLGMLTGLAGFAMLSWAIWRWFEEGTIIGWTSTIAVMLIMGSIQLIILGVFGDYLGRLYIESKGRPLFIVREVRSQSRAAQRGAIELPLTAGALDPRG